jgi:ATP-dependent helicase/nuclease subunit A
MTWKKEQLDAIMREGNLLVSAGAGSGKTAVLTERVCRLIAGGVGVDEILVVTFTNAAADEMKKRVEARLGELLGERGGHDERIRRELMRLGSADICTLHAFCAQLLRRHFSAAQVDPAFRIADETEAALLSREALEETLETGYALDMDGLLRLSRALGGDDALMDTMESVYKFIHAQPDPFDWLGASVTLYNASEDAFLASPAAERLAELARERLIEAADLLKRARALVKGKDGLDKVDEKLWFEAMAADVLASREGYEALLNIDASFFTALRWPKDAPEALKNEVVNLRDEAKALIKSVNAELVLDVDAQRERLKQAYPLMLELYRQLTRYDEIYKRIKAERGAVDFTDIEHCALRALGDEQVAAEYRQKFKYVFVDEYQDINQVQNALLERLTHGDNLFAVGDVKQSIYRFRLAEPGLFLRRYAAYSACEDGTCIDLTVNFRSALSVICAVNGVFTRVMTKRFGDLDYRAAQLLPGRDETPSGEAELHIIEKAAADDASEAAELESAELEALLGARRIREIVGTPFEGQGRDYGYGDFAVLLRDPKRSAKVWARILAMEGVPAYSDAAGGYFETMELQLLVNILRVIDNRRQDVPLIGVLRSPAGGFDIEQLISIRTDFEGGSYFERLCAAAKDVSPLGKKARAFLEKIDAWQSDARFYRMEEFISRLLGETGLYDFVGALPGGRQRQANLEELLTRARLFEQAAGRGVGGFLKFMDKLKLAGTSVNAAATRDALGVVRLLSVHKSKGLEFPVVILPGLARQFNNEAKREHLSMHTAMGVGLRFIDEQTHMRADTLYRRAIALRNAREDAQEELRVLYVGMTRAQSRLIMIAAVKDIAKLAEKTREARTPYRFSQARRMIDWILPALIELPDANPIRRLAGMGEIEGEANIRMTLHAAGEFTVSGGSAQGREALEVFEARASKEDGAFIAERFGWRYPYEADTRVSAKLSASMLSGTRAELISAPLFMQQKATPAQRGSATHKALQFVPLEAMDEARLEKELESLESGALTGAERALVDKKLILAFFASALGRRLLAAGRVERELAFSVDVPAREAVGVDSDGEILVQGVIDCCFIENEEWVIIDYKTDRVFNAFEAAAGKYAPQVRLYAYALEKLTCRRVKETYIHFLQAGVSVRM